MIPSISIIKKTVVTTPPKNRILVKFYLNFMERCSIQSKLFINEETIEPYVKRLKTFSVKSSTRASAVKKYSKIETVSLF